MKPLINKYRVLTFCIFLVLGIALLWWLSIPNTKPVTIRQTGVNLPYITVSLYKADEFYKAPGTVTPSVQSELMAQVTANVTHVYAFPGEKVRAGQLLVQLDSRNFEAKVAQAKQQVKAMQALLTNAKLVHQRMGKLIKKGFVSSAQFDQAEANYLQAQANLSQSEKALKSAEINLSYCRIIAPTKGIILQKFVNLGDQTNPLKPLFTFQADSALRLNADVPEALLNKVKINQKLTVTINASQDKVRGVVTEIVPSVNPSTRSFVVKVTLPGTLHVYSGMFGRLWIPVKSEKIIAVPNNYIRHDGQLDLVYILQHNQLNRVFITTGKLLKKNYVQVLSGVNVGDKLVLPELSHAK